MQRVCGAERRAGACRQVHRRASLCSVCGAEWWAGACRQVHRRASLCSVCAVLSGGLVLVGRYIEGLACAACVRC